jgi:dTDP-glucose 4,6-dehydratase
MNKKIIVTGGNGFIGQNFLNKIYKKNFDIVNIDCLDYSSDKFAHKRFDKIKFCKVNICDKDKVKDIFDSCNPDIVINFAAHSHVDRSIKNSSDFLENIIGTHNLLLNTLNIFKKKKIKFLQISTDEVFGSIAKGAFNENSPYRPNSPYSSSKASCDHLVRAFNKTYGVPTAITYSCNNYGPYQHLEKLIPLTLFKILSGKKMGIYGNGNQRRQWIYVDDNIDLIIKIMNSKFDGSTYCLGSANEIDNLSLVKKIIQILLKKKKIQLKLNNFQHLIKYINDRPGHDFRYFISSNKIKTKFNLPKQISFEQGLENTIDWYIKNQKWVKLQSKKLNTILNKY